MGSLQHLERVRTSDPIDSAANTARIEAQAIATLADAFRDGPLGPAFADAVRVIVESRGRVIVSGMGKSGLIGRKVAATLSSTGTAAMFLHPSEASHGDLGMIAKEDILLAFSWSGETAELGDVVTFCRRFGNPLIAVTSRAESTLARQADTRLTLPCVQEACPNRLAPTSSAVVQLALGDALAIALVEQRGFSAEDFKIFHPGGKLGAQLCTVAELMGRGPDIPRVQADATILEATYEMTGKRYGSTAVVDGNGHLIGAFTDGDLRRSINARNMDTQVSEHMTVRPTHVPPGMLASEALAIMNSRNILQLFVCDDGRLAGVIHIHDIIRAGVV